jgi:hypothetical protein
MSIKIAFACLFSESRITKGDGAPDVKKICSCPLPFDKHLRWSRKKVAEASFLFVLYFKFMFCTFFSASEYYLRKKICLETRPE